MTIVIVCALLVGFIVGVAVSFIVKPRRDPDPAVRKLLDDYASAVTQAQIHMNIDNPNILNDETKRIFTALKERYYKELIK